MIPDPLLGIGRFMLGVVAIPLTIAGLFVSHIIGVALAESRSYLLKVGVVLTLMAGLVGCFVLLDAWHEPTIQFLTGIGTSVMLLLALVATMKQRQRDKFRSSGGDGDE